MILENGLKKLDNDSVRTGGLSIDCLSLCRAVDDLEKDSGVCSEFEDKRDSAISLL